MSDPVNCYVAAPQARATLGNVSEMTLWRWLKNDPAFPRPVVICRRRYWRLSELMAYMERHRTPADPSNDNPTA